MNISKSVVSIRVVVEATKKVGLTTMVSTKTTEKIAKRVTGRTSTMISSKMEATSAKEIEEVDMAGIKEEIKEPNSHPISVSIICTMCYSTRLSLRRKKLHTNSRYSCFWIAKESRKRKNSQRRRSHRTMLS